MKNAAVRWSLALVAVIALLAWRHSLNAPPRLEIPMPMMPARNAFDLYGSAADALKESRAIDLVTSSGRASPGEEPGPSGVLSETPLFDAATLVRMNGTALALLREGLDGEYFEPPARSSSHQFPHYGAYRQLARLLRLEARLRADNGDWSGALDSFLDAVRLGEECQRGAPLIGMLTGTAIQATGREGAWDTVEYLDAAQARRAAARLEATLARGVPLADTLTEEKWLGLATLKELVDRPDWQPALLRAALTSAARFPPGWSDVGLRVQLAVTSKSAVLRNYARHFDAMTEQVRRPYPERGPLLRPTDPLTLRLLPVLSQAAFVKTRSDTFNRLLLTLLALRAYRLDRAAYPAALTELVPEYLEEVPADPFGEGPLRYENRGESYLLYSIGPDGVDNGGRPYTNTRRSRRAPILQIFSEGDVVANVNRR